MGYRIQVEGNQLTCEAFELGESGIDDILKFCEFIELKLDIRRSCDFL